MTSSPLKSHPAFLGLLPPKLELSPNSGENLIIDALQTGDIYIKKGTNINLIALLQDGWEDRQSLNFHFEEEDCNFTFLALIIGRDQNSFPFETISTHTAQHTNAYYYIRAAQFDKSIVNYRGMLAIKPNAQITDSYLAHHTLLLSETAKTYTIPSLEIEADDVKAGHAASLGRIDEDLLFYLQSRGLNADCAQEILIQGFMESDFSKIADEELRQLLSQEISNSLT